MIKKKLLTSVALGLCVLGASAAISTRDVEEGLLFGYCGEDIATVLGARGAEVSAAIEVPVSISSQWGSNASVKQVIIGYGQTSNMNVKVFLTYDLKGEPFYTQDAVMSQNRGWNVVSLDTPYTVTDKTFYVGYSSDCIETDDKPIAFDGIITNDTYGDNVDLYDGWEHSGEFFGNVCLRLIVTGDALPQYEAAATSLELPNLVQAGEPFAALLYITNNGVKTITDVTLKVNVEGEELENPQTSLPEGPIPSGYTGIVEISGLVTQTIGKDLPVEVTLLTVNGNADEMSDDNSTSSTFNSAEKAFKQMVLFEEFTGTWCGNCPIGIYAMSQMREKYGDDFFVGLAGHYGDPMQANSYSPVVDLYGGTVPGSPALPSSIINRSIKTYPALENFEYYYPFFTRSYAPAEVTFDALYDTDEAVLYVNSETEFSFDNENAKYALAFAITEDNVGPYVQENYYAKDKSIYVPGWSNAPGEVETTFNEVVRDIKDAFGISGSLPSEIEGGMKYKYDTTLPLTNVKDINECEVVAILLDTQTGEVVNSNKAHIKFIDAGIEGIEDQPHDGIIHVYNPQGIKVLQTKDASAVNSLPKGIYIINGKKVKL